MPKWAEVACKSQVIFYESSDVNSPPCELHIKTLEGVHRVSVGDYVIQGVKGEIYPCKPDIFEMTYELVENIESGKATK